jgi:hypothetical protein
MCVYICNYCQYVYVISTCVSNTNWNHDLTGFCLHGPNEYVFLVLHSGCVLYTGL